MASRLSRILVIVGAISLLGAMVVAPPAAAATDWPLTWNGSAPTPSSLPSAQAGDTFTLTISSGGSIFVENGSGTAALNGAPCAPGTPTCVVTPQGPQTFTITSTGVVFITQGEFSTPVALTLGAGGGSSSVTYPTLSLDPNGGSCLGTLAFERHGGQNDTVVLPSTTTCTRSGYTLTGWARTATPDVVEFAPGGVVTVANESFTLVAVWSYTSGVLVTYDANVAWHDACLDTKGTNIPDDVVWSDSRRAFDVTRNNRLTTQAQAPTSEPAHTATCKPPYAVLAGWSTSAADSGQGLFPTGKYAGTFFALTKSLNSTDTALTDGKTLTLYAVWAFARIAMHVTYNTTSGMTPLRHDVPVPWGSTLASAPTTLAPGPISTTGCASTPVEVVQRGLDGRQDTDIPVSLYFEATDTLGEPAPYTQFFVFSQNAVLTFYTIELDFSGLTYPTTHTIPKNGFAIFVTGPHGKTGFDVHPTGAKPGVLLDTFEESLGVYACPETSTTSGFGSDPTLLALTGGQPFNVAAMTIPRHGDCKAAAAPKVNWVMCDLGARDLRQASLASADLRLTSLTAAKLQQADLNGANLQQADIHQANAASAHLRYANLAYANLSGAKLAGADLTGAVLIGADLTGADLSGATTTGANFTGAKLDNVKR